MKYFYINDPGAGERQSSGLLLFVTDTGKIVGICDEDDSATYDIALAAEPKTADDATWLAWDASLGTKPASWGDIVKNGLAHYLTGIINFDNETIRPDYIVFNEVVTGPDIDE